MNTSPTLISFLASNYFIYSYTPSIILFAFSIVIILACLSISYCSFVIDILWSAVSITGTRMLVSVLGRFNLSGAVRKSMNVYNSTTFSFVSVV